MTAWPPPYPRVPHLPPAPGATRDDLVLSADEAAELFRWDVVIEEKLDGANVVLWLDEGGLVQAATRGGPGALDRAGQLGPLRAWVASRTDVLRDLLAGGGALYAEWLWLAHSVRYDALPDWLVAIDLLLPAGWTPVGVRDEVLASAGVATPPRLFSGRWDAGSLERLLGRSRFGSESAEGLVVRPADPKKKVPRVAKLLAQGFERLSDDEWHSRRRRNSLARASVA